MSNGAQQIRLPQESLPSATHTDLPREQFSPGDAVILIVDDEPTIIELLRIYLEDAGYRRFVTTTDPTEALRLIEESAPDAVLLDVLMPGLNGLEILARIRAMAQPSPMPVLILTSATDAPTKHEALKLGATDFLGKPVDPSELVLRLHNVLAAKTYQDRLAYVDEVTGLLNRRHLLERLERTLAAGARRTSPACTLLHIGLDRFQKINAALGFNETESLLRAVAKRIESHLRSGDLLRRASAEGQDGVLWRIESDEFMVLLSDPESIAAVPKIAQRMLDAFDSPITCGAHELRLSASVGVVSCPPDGADADALMTHAARAMQYARDNGSGTIQYYSDEIQSWALERVQFEVDLRSAITSDALSLHYQPKVHLRTGRIYGVEALMRWTHPERGSVSPAHFIPVAEQAGLIQSMGAWALRKACAQAAAWSQAGVPELSVAVNVSACQLDDDALPDLVNQALSEGGLSADRLTLELTESMIMSDPEHSVRILQGLKTLGVRVSVDDFGTGYSSLAYLKRLPLDELKIDQSFVRDIPNDKDDMAIVSAVVALARSLDLFLVAEGVETDAQRDFLAALDCSAYQGFLFARPMPAAGIEALFR